MNYNYNGNGLPEGGENGLYNNNPEKSGPDQLKEYLHIIRLNLLPVVLIFITCVIITIVYISSAVDIYRATTTLKIENPKGSILDVPLAGISDPGNDRYISNQIEVLKSYYIRDVVAKALIDSVKKINDTQRFFVIVNRHEDHIEMRNEESLRKALLVLISIEQKRGLDAVDISVESPSFFEAQLIANTYASIYVDYAKELSRQDITNVKQFLGDEKEKKFRDLNIAESSLEDFQNRHGIIALGEQAKELVSQITNYEAQKNSADIQLRANERVLSSLRNEFNEFDPNLSTYVQGQVSQPYMQELQRQIANLEVTKDLELSTINDTRAREKIERDFDEKISRLNVNLNREVEILKRSVIADTPEEKRELASQLLDASLLNQSLRSMSASISPILSRYESEFSKLPSQSITLAKLERDRMSNEKLFLILEEKFQEASINERARLGNAVIIDPGSDNFGPVKPKRQTILIAGIVIGLALGFGYAFAKNYFDRTIKTPDELDKQGVSVLAWVPSVEGLFGDVKTPLSELVVLNNPKATVSESFKALRTRVQFSKLESDPLKTILVTSSIPSEGKTFIAVNLASSFAQADKKTLILDCDLRKPRIHNVFSMDRFPGLSDYLFSKVTLEDIIRDTKNENFKVITGGTIPPNPSELLGSVQMKDFINLLKTKFDYIILDSPPFISVTDAELLFNATDGTILVAQSNKTPIDAFWKTYERLTRINKHDFLGVVLNNFNVRTAYGYYYNYYYYYSKTEKEKV